MSYSTAIIPRYAERTVCKGHLYELEINYEKYWR